MADVCVLGARAAESGPVLHQPARSGASSSETTARPSPPIRRRSRPFFYGDSSPAPGRGGRSEFALVRVVDGRGWIERVRVTPASLEIDLGGTQAEGARVELNSATQRTAVPTAEGSRVSVPLPEGLPRGAWLYLSRDREWLDYRAIGEAMGQGDLARTGVEVEVPDDPESVIGALLAAGEGSSTEFKRQLPGDSDESKRKVFKTVAAFANVVSARSSRANRTNRNRHQASTAQNTCSPPSAPQSITRCSPGDHTAGRRPR
jgi:hypothetical protein